MLARVHIFAQVLLSDRGCVLYAGPTGAAVSHFEAMGFRKAAVSFAAATRTASHCAVAECGVRVRVSDGEFLVKVACGLVPRTGIYTYGSELLFHLISSLRTHCYFISSHLCVCVRAYAVRPTAAAVHSLTDA